MAVGVLCLVALQALTSKNGPAGGAAGLDLAGRAVQRLLSPDVAGIPNRTGAGLPAPKVNVDPKTGVPNQNPNLPPVRDPRGYIY